MNNTSSARKLISRTSWPHGVSSEPAYAIGKVHEILLKEFPSVSQAKLRLLEKHGIVSPARLDNGYRGYSLADIERIRYALRMQRDSYLPLDQIGENLAILDQGGQPAPTEPVARIVSRDGNLDSPPRSTRITVRQLMDYTGATNEDLEDMVATKLITPDLSSRFPSGAVDVVRAVLALEEKGITPRSLRPSRSAANASLDLIESLTFAQRTKNHGAARERVRVQAYELTEIMSDLIKSLILQGVEELD